MNFEAQLLNKRILIVDDDVSLSKSIKEVLVSRGFKNISNAYSISEGIDIFSISKIDLIILDVMLPDGEGYLLAQYIRKTSDIPILFLTAKGQESDKTLGFSSGGDDYLTKPFSYNELNARVKALLRRYHVYQGKERHEENTIQIIGDLEINQSKKEVRRQGKKLALTDLEYEILGYLLLNRKQVISASQLFEAIWHENYYYGANNTIMVHIRNLRKKIEHDPQDPQIIKTVWGKGYYID